MAPAELTHDPLALLDAPRPPSRNEHLQALADKFDAGVREFTDAMDDCANAAVEAEEEMGKLLRVTKCQDCHKLYRADSERLHKATLLSTSGLAGPMELPITLCDECVTGVERRSKKPDYTNGTTLTLSDLYSTMDGLKLKSTGFQTFYHPSVLSGSNPWHITNSAVANTVS